MVAATAGEVEKEDDMPKAINWTVFLLIGVYIVCMLVLNALLPWYAADLHGSPFAYVFQRSGLNGAALREHPSAHIALTSGNYFVYGCTRYLWSMSKFKQAPKFGAKTNSKGVPVNALIVSMVFAVLGILAQFVAEDSVYLVLIYLIGGCNIFYYTVVCICQYKFRKRFLAEGGKIQDLKFRVKLFPLTPILGVLAFLAMLVVTLLDPSQAVAIYVCAPCYLAIYIASHFYYKKHGVTVKNIDL